MPAVPRKPDKPPLTLFRHLWDHSRPLTTKDGQPFASHAEARSYAAREGYKGIRVRFAGPGMEELSGVSVE